MTSQETARPLTLELVSDGIHTRRWCFALDVEKERNALLTDPLFDGDLSDKAVEGGEKELSLGVGEWIEAEVEGLLRQNKIETMDIPDVSAWQIASGLAYKFALALASHGKTKEVVYYFSQIKTEEEARNER